MPNAAPADAAPDPLASRLPVTIITGFLGSGKTTLLSRLLRDPSMRGSAVIINEFGDVPLDHELVEASSEQITLLGNGCICCTLHTDLQETLRELFVRRRAGEVIDFDRVFVETTGLADPLPLLHTFTDGLIRAQYRLNGVITLVDGVNGLGQLDTMPEAVRQVAAADRVVITKTDIAPASAIDALRQRIDAVNPFASIMTARNGALDPREVEAIGLQSAVPDSDEVARWIGVTDRPDPSALAARHEARTTAHLAGIDAFCLWFDSPFTWDGLDAALQALAALRGPDLLRFKGIVHVRGETGAVVLQGAQHVFHPPVTLRSADDHRSRIVFIVRNIPRTAIEGLFAAVGALDTAAHAGD